MKNFSEYNEYQIEQWVEDADFVNWVKSPTAESNAFFTALMATDAVIAQRMEAAAQFLRAAAHDEPSLSDKDIELMWTNIARQTIESPKKRIYFPYLKIAAVAASLVILIGIAWVLLIPSGTNAPDYKLMSSVLHVDSVTEIQLLMPDHSSMCLSNRSEVILTDEHQITVRTARGEKLSYRRDQNNNENYLQLIVPKGKRASVVLADGSRVMVRPGSKVIVPVRYAASRRELYTEGEIFLEVTKNPHKPFIVKSEQMQVEVLGTSFNVTAYPGDKTQSVVLVTGSVKVQSEDGNTVKIKPNQRYQYDKTEKTQSVEEVDVYPYISWKDGVLSCNSESLSNVLARLSEYYGVRFSYDQESMSRIKITGKLDLNHDVSDALKIIATTSPIKYQNFQSYIQVSVKPQN